MVILHVDFIVYMALFKTLWVHGTSVAIGSYLNLTMVVTTYGKPLVSNIGIKYTS